jgi:hypothetical protein
MATRRAIVLLSAITVAAVASADYPFDGIPLKAKNFACSPQTLHRGDELTIRVSAPHGTDLGIWTPANEFFFVYSCDQRIRSTQWRDVDCEAFARQLRIAIAVSTLESVSTKLQSSRQRVFAEPGRYTVLLAKNLETENDEASVNRCNVEFRPK